MGEYVPTSIKFGGKLQAKFVETLIVLLNDKMFCTDQDGENPDRTNLNERFRADEVNYGQIEAIVDFCKTHQLDYEHWIDACSGEDPTIERWVSGERESLSFSDGEVMIPLARVLEVETLVSGMANLLARAKRWNTPLELKII